MTSTTATSVISDPNPFRGLRPFEEEQAHLFFGREEQTDDLLRKLRTSRFLAVVGTSGSGKSSLVRAGLIPSLKRGYLAESGATWRVAVMRPFEHPDARPLLALESALADPDALGPQPERTELLRRDSFGLANSAAQALDRHDSLLIVVDQFEEIFRFRDVVRNAAEEADWFVASLLAATEQRDASIYVVLTMRSEYLGDCAVFRGLPEAINKAQYLVPALTRQQLGEAIEGPVRQRRGSLAPGLLQRVLNDTYGLEGELDRLPIVQHALTETWRRAVGSPQLELEHYKDIGGTADALGQQADGVLAELRKAGVAEVLPRRLFKRLTVKTAQSRDLRRPSTFKDLLESTGTTREALLDVIDAFRPFLVAPERKAISDHSVIDIAHESLIRRWHSLTKWVGEEADAAATYRRLVDDARKERRVWVNPDLALAKGYLKSGDWNPAWAARYSDGAGDYASAQGFLARSSRAQFLRLGAIAAAVAVVLAAGAWIYLTNEEAHEAKAQLAAKEATLTTLENDLKSREEQISLLTNQAQKAQESADLLRQQAAQSTDAKTRQEYIERARYFEQQNEILKQQAAKNARAADDTKAKINSTENNYAAQYPISKDPAADITRERDSLRNSNTDLSNRVKVLEAQLAESKAAVSRVQAGAPDTERIEITLESIEVLQDGSGGQSGWVFQVEIDGRPVIVLPKRNYSNREATRIVTVNRRQAVTLGVRDAPSISVTGQRTFGNDTVQGEEPIRSGTVFVNVTNGDPRKGAFRFKFSVGSPAKAR